MMKAARLLFALLGASCFYEQKTLDGVCPNGVCPKDLGQSCTANRECKDVCVGGVCVVPSPMGGACDEDGDCTTGLHCGANGCAKADGAACDSNDKCAHTCIGGFCALWSSTLGPCEEQGDCAWGHVCVDGACKLENGQSCNANGQCVGVCIAGVCASVSPPGGACDEHADCELGYECGVSFQCALPLAQPCNSPAECASGFCADAVCCDSACDGNCMACGADGLCDDTPADDDGCGNIECDGRDWICRDYHDLTAGRCADFGVCKAANSADCMSYTDATPSTPCRSIAGLCDAEDFCDGQGGCSDAKQDASLPCRSAGGTCDTAEYCDGVNNGCPPVVITPCSGVNYRSIGGAGTLWSGTCTPFPALGSVDFDSPVPAGVGVGDEIRIGAASPLHVLDVDVSRMSALVQTTPGTASGSCAVARAYGDLQAWEDGRQGDLVAENRSEVGLVYNDGTLVGSLVIAGSTTDPGHTLRIEPALGSWHAGVAGTGVVLQGGDGVAITDSDVTLRGLELAYTASAVAAIGVAGSRVRIEEMIIHNSSVKGVYAFAGSDTTIRNSVVYNVGEVGISALGSGAIENCTVVNATAAGVYAVSPVQVVNTIAMGNGTDFSASNQSHNVSGDGTASGTGSLANQSPALYFTIFNDFHLAPTASAVDAGMDLSARFSTDLDGELRPLGAAWDIGADEAAPAPGNCCPACDVGYTCCCNICIAVSDVCTNIWCVCDPQS